MDNDLIRKKTADYLLGRLSGTEAEEIKRALGANEPTDTGLDAALEILLAERLAEKVLLEKMEGWETELGQSIDTEAERLEFLMNERQSEADLFGKMEAWEAEIQQDDLPKPVRRWWSFVGLGLLLLSLLVWSLWPRSPQVETPATQQSLPTTGDSLQQSPVQKSQPQAQQNSQPLAPGSNRYLAMAMERYRESPIAPINLRSVNGEMPNPPLLSTASVDSLKKSILSDFNRKDWHKSIVALDTSLNDLPGDFKSEFLLWVGGVLFENQRFEPAIAVFSLPSLRNSAEYAYDAQWYEFLSRLAALPSDRQGFERLTRSIEANANNPNRDAVKEILLMMK